MFKLNEGKIKELEKTANNIRKNIIKMLSLAKSGHTAGALGMADIFTFLYFYALKHDPSNPNLKNKDHLVLSNGHICPVLYATMAEAQYFNKNELFNLRKFGSMLQGHPHREFMPIIETSSGPLGEGLSQAIGIALALKIDNKDMGDGNNIFCISSDGELNEGQTWEAVMLAAKEKLNKLILIIDRNNIQIEGNTEEIMPLENLKNKFESFNWFVKEINGHDFNEMNEAIIKAQENTNKPSVIIAHTTPSKGIKKWENDYRWHGKTPNQKEAEEAIIELNKLYA